MGRGNGGEIRCDGREGDGVEDGCDNGVMMVIIIMVIMRRGKM